MPNNSDRAVFVIVPVYNEAEVLGSVLSKLLKLYPNVVVVDDGSSDASSRIAHSAGATVLRHLYNLGQGAALQTGIEYALRNNAGYIVTFDGDGQHLPADIARLIEPLRKEEADVALGSRFLGTAQGMPPSRRILLRAAVIFSRAINRIPVTDTHNGLRAFTERAARKLQITMNRMAHASQILDQIREAELRFVEVPVTVHYTKYSRSKGQANSAGALVLWDYLIGKLIR